MRYACIPLLLIAIAAYGGAGMAAPGETRAKPAVTKGAVASKRATKGAVRRPAAKPKTAAGAKSAAAKAKTATAAKAPAKKPASAAAKAVAAQIREQAGGSVRSFYAARGYWPLWAGEGRIGAEANAFVAMLASANLDGLDPRSYDVAALRDMLARAASGEPAAVAGAELALSRNLARYVADVRRPPKVGMTYLDEELKPRRLRAADVLRAAAMPTDFGAYVSAMGWMNPQYLRIRKLMAGGEAAGLSRDGLARLRLNLDRARLLPGPWVRHIVVDAASAQLFYYQGGKQQGTMRVVAGTPETPTPMLAGMVRYAILNPYWNVPVDLAAKRVAPKVLAGASLKSLRFEALSDWSATPTRLDQSEIDWQAVAAGKREVRLRQLPGGSNAMGRVKFMFPNDQGIYLHDTPDKGLMAKPARHFSNGCVRLEDAPRLGRWLLGKPLTALTKQPEQDVALAEPVPVYLTYFTATPIRSGVGFLTDVYRRDGKTVD